MPTTTRPFHETIVDAIHRRPGMSEMLCLFQLIEETTIPKDHDKIVGAVDKCFDFVGAGKFASDIRRVKESILAQKEFRADSPDDDCDVQVSAPEPESPPPITVTGDSDDEIDAAIEGGRYARVGDGP